jgi:hypothetical protein
MRDLTFIQLNPLPVQFETLVCGAVSPVFPGYLHFKLIFCFTVLEGAGSYLFFYIRRSEEIREDLCNEHSIDYTEQNSF